MRHFQTWFWCFLFSSSVARFESAEEYRHSVFDHLGSGARIDIGVSTSAYQIEGAYRVDGKSWSIWDDFAHRNPSPIIDQSTGDTACDSYQWFREDAALVSSLGLRHYRFSLSWPRIFPTENFSEPNPIGVAYYHNVIDHLLEKGITPWATLFHWDLPLHLQEKYGGFTSREIIRDFTRYADFCFATFGNKIRHWITINEPLTFCQMGYTYGAHAPGFRDPNLQYLVGHHMLLSHASVYHLYHETYAAKQKGIVSISLNSDYFYPETSSPGDVQASDYIMSQKLGWFSGPVLTGNYPDSMRNDKTIFLPVFTEDEKAMLRMSLDFFALNHYASFRVAATNPESVSMETIRFSNVPGSVPTASSWLMAYPPGIRATIEWLHQKHPEEMATIPLVITENGVSSAPDEMNDVVRYTVLPQYYQELYKARETTGVNITHYFIWSLLDNFEWSAGYTERFGLFYVDFWNESRPRIPKRSVFELFPFYSSIPN